MKRTRIPTNWDDDSQVEAYKADKARKATIKENAEVAAKNAGLLDDEVINTISKNVNQIVDNIRNGDSPVPLTNAFMIIQQPNKLANAKAVIVMGFYPEYTETSDYKLFQSLISDEVFGMSDSFKTQMVAGKTVAKAIEAIVDEAVEEGKITTTEEAVRLKSIYRVWMKGVSWAKCQLTP
jgi:hypothetical protein